MQRVVKAVLCYLFVSGVALGATTIDCDDADTQCWYIEANTATATGCGDCTVGAPCDNPNWILDNCMDDMSNKAAHATTCTGDCSQKGLILLDGWHLVSQFAALSTTYTKTVRQESGVLFDDGVNGGVVFHVKDTGTCTDCFIVAQNLGTAPPDGMAAREILMDGDRNGNIEYENSVMIDCEATYGWQDPLQPIDRDHYECVVFALESGSWTIQGISTFTRTSNYFDGVGTLNLDRVGFQFDSQNYRGPYNLDLRGLTVGATGEASAFINAGHDTLCRNAHAWDTAQGIMTTSGSDDITVSDSYLFCGPQGPSHIGSNTILIKNNVIRHASTHGGLFDVNDGASSAGTTHDVIYQNNIIGGQPYGRCGDSARYCINPGAATEGAGVGSSCTCADGGSDLNGDGCDDTTTCSGDDYCGINPWALSRRLCRPSAGNGGSADCTGGSVQTDFVPSSTGQYGGDAIPSNRNWVDADASECLVEDSYCIAFGPLKTYTNADPFMGCGYVTDRDWASYCTGSGVDHQCVTDSECTRLQCQGGDDDGDTCATSATCTNSSDCSAEGGTCEGGVYQWASGGGESANACLNNLTFTNEAEASPDPSCTMASDGQCGGDFGGGCTHLWRHTRFSEPGEGADGVCFVNNTISGYGYAIASIIDKGSRFNGAGPFNDCDEASEDCNATDWCYVNNLMVDLAYGGEVVIAVKYASNLTDDQKGGQGWEWNNNAIGGRPDTVPFDRAAPTGWDDQTSFKSFVAHFDDGAATEVALSASSVETVSVSAADTHSLCRTISQTPDSMCSHGHITGNCDGGGANQGIECNATLGTDAGCSSNTTYVECYSNSVDSDFDESGIASGNLWDSAICNDFTDYYGDDLMPIASGIMVDAGQTAVIVRAAGAGGNITIPTEDFYHNARDASPDIGAVEYVLPANATAVGVVLKGVAFN